MFVKRYLQFLFFVFASVFSSFAFGEENYQPVKTNSGLEGGITAMTTDPFLKYLIAGDTKGNLYFYDLRTGEFIEKIHVHSAAVSQLRFNSNGRLLITSTADGEIKIYDLDKEKVVQGIYSPDYTGINFVLFSIADGFIYFNGNNRLYKTRSDLTQSVNKLYEERDTLYDAVITSDRSSLIYCSGNTIKILNTRTDGVRQEIAFGSSTIRRLALVKDTLLATWSADGTLAFWKYELNQLQATPLFSLKAGSPSAMAFSDDGQLMCSGNIGNWARIWKPMQKEVLQELFIHKETVTSSAFGKSKEFLFTGSLDHSIIMWQKGAPPVEIPKIVPPPVPAPVQKTESTPPPVVENVVMNENNIPKVIAGREVMSTEKIEVTSDRVQVFVYDNGYIDGDTMSLFFNGKWIVDHYGVTKKKYPVELQLLPNTNNYLVLFANNLGKSPPNTAAIEIVQGDTRRIFRLSSNLKTCSAVNFYYKK